MTDENPNFEKFFLKSKTQELYGHPHEAHGKLIGVQIGIGFVGALLLTKEEWEKRFPDLVNNHPDVELIKFKDEMNERISKNQNKER